VKRDPLGDVLGVAIGNQPDSVCLTRLLDPGV
jgi:hypothetical protein